MKWTNLTPWIWASVISGSWLYFYLTQQKDHKRVQVRTLAGQLLSTAWIGCSISMALLVSAGNINGTLKAWSVQPIIALFIGLGFFTSSAIYNYRLLRLIAVGWWTGAVVMFIWPSEYNSLIIGSMMILFYLLPGMILYHYFKKELAENPNDRL